MSTFGTPGQPARISRDRAPQYRRQGNVESLSAPGLVPVPPVSYESNIIGQLDQALGLVGNAAAADAHYVARQNALAVETDRGLANKHAAEVLPRLQVDIESGKIAARNPDEIPHVAEQIIAQEAASNSPAYMEEFSRQLTPALNRALQGKSAAITAEARAQEFATLSHTLDTPSVDAARVGEVLADARKKAAGATDAELYGSIVLPAAQRAAEFGHTDRFKVLSDQLPDSFANDKAKLQIQATAAAERNRQQREQTAAEVVYADINKAIAGVGSFAQADQTIADLKKSGAIDEHTAFTLGQTVRSQQADQLRANYNGLKDQFIKDQTDATAAQLLPLLDRGDVTGGAPMFTHDVPVNFPDGTTKVIKGADIIEAARLQKWAQIDKAYPPSAVPQENFAAKLSWLAKNPGVKDPVLEQGFSGARFRIQADTTDQNVQPSLVSSYQLFKVGTRMNKEVIAAHMTAADQDFFRVAQFLEENIPDTTPGNALRMSAQAVTANPNPSQAITRTLDAKALSVATKDLPASQNPNTAKGTIEARARAYIMISGKDDAAAVKQATKDFQQDYSMLNGWWVRTRGRPVLSAINLPTTAKAIVGAYANEHNEDAKDFTIIPDQTTGGWTVSMMDTGIPAPGSPVFSDADLSVIHGEISGIDQRKIATETAAKSKDIQTKRAARQWSNLTQVALAMKSHDAGYSEGFGGFNIPDTTALFAEPAPATPAEPAPPDHLASIIAYIRNPPKRKETPFEVPSSVMKGFIK